MKKSLIRINHLILFALIVLFPLVSCVNDDYYELYDESEELSIAGLTSRTKWNSDVMKGSTGGYGGKAIFYSTECAAFALSYYLSGNKLEGQIDNVIKLKAIKALMNWDYDDYDYSFVDNPERNEEYKTAIMDAGGGAYVQSQMIPAIKRLFNEEYYDSASKNSYMKAMVDSNGDYKGGMFYIVTSGHVSVPYAYDSDTGTFSCYDCDGSDFEAKLKDIHCVLMKK